MVAPPLKQASDRSLMICLDVSASTDCNRQHKAHEIAVCANKLTHTPSSQCAMPQTKKSIEIRLSQPQPQSTQLHHFIFLLYRALASELPFVLC